MRILQNPTRPVSNNQLPIQDRDLTAAFTGQEAYEEIGQRAQSVSLIKLFKHYNINIDQYNRKCTCPFSKHKGGRESTASFYYYPETNTFWCFGCKTGSNPVDLVANLEGCNKIQAAMKILNSFADGEQSLDLNREGRDTYKERVDLIFSFSSKVRDMLLSSPERQPAIEGICSSFDKMNDKYELDIPALTYLISRILDKLEDIK